MSPHTGIAISNPLRLGREQLERLKEIVDELEKQPDVLREYELTRKFVEITGFEISPIGLYRVVPANNFSVVVYVEGCDSYKCMKSKWRDLLRVASLLVSRVPALVNEIADALSDESIRELLERDVAQDLSIRLDEATIDRIVERHRAIATIARNGVLLGAATLNNYHYQLGLDLTSECISELENTLLDVLGSGWAQTAADRLSLLLSSAGIIYWYMHRDRKGTVLDPRARVAVDRGIELDEQGKKIALMLADARDPESVAELLEAFDRWCAGAEAWLNSFADTLRSRSNELLKELVNTLLETVKAVRSSLSTYSTSRAVAALAKLDNVYRYTLNQGILFRTGRTWADIANSLVTAFHRVVEILASISASRSRGVCIGTSAECHAIANAFDRFVDTMYVKGMIADEDAGSPMAIVSDGVALIRLGSAPEHVSRIEFRDGVAEVVYLDEDESVRKYVESLLSHTARCVCRDELGLRAARCRCAYSSVEELAYIAMALATSISFDIDVSEYAKRIEERQSLISLSIANAIASRLRKRATRFIAETAFLVGYMMGGVKAAIENMIINLNSMPHLDKSGKMQIAEEIASRYGCIIKEEGGRTLVCDKTGSCTSTVFTIVEETV